MKDNRIRTWILLFLGFCITACIVLSIAFFNRTSEEIIKIGFVMSGRIDENGWNGEHYHAISQACRECGVTLLLKENVEEYTGQCITAVKELVQEGAHMIILSSYGYSAEVKELVEEYPEVIFYTNSSEYHTSNMTSYFVRMYQARYLSGILAGMTTKENKIGYVAAMPNNEVNRGINAFAMGVKSVNENAKVLVTWTGKWDDESKERQAAANLMDKAGVDVITYHQNQDYVIQEAEARGVSSIGYHTQFEGFSENYLTSVVYNLTPVYCQLIKEYMKGKGNSRTNYWIGIEAGAVGLSGYSSRVTEEMKSRVALATDRMMKGEAIFTGRIYDTEGKLRCDENEVIGDETLLEQLDWFIEGIEFYE